MVSVKFHTPTIGPDKQIFWEWNCNNFYNHEFKHVLGSQKKHLSEKVERDVHTLLAVSCKLKNYLTAALKCIKLTIIGLEN